MAAQPLPVVNKRSSRVRWDWLALLVAALAGGCGETTPPALEGRPKGPYRLTLETAPAPPVPDTETEITLTLTRRASDTPVTDLQQVHERP